MAFESLSHTHGDFKVRETIRCYESYSSNEFVHIATVGICPRYAGSVVCKIMEWEHFLNKREIIINMIITRVANVFCLPSVSSQNHSAWSLIKSSRIVLIATILLCEPDSHYYDGCQESDLFCFAFSFSFFPHFYSFAEFAK